MKVLLGVIFLIASAAMAAAPAQTSVSPRERNDTRTAESEMIKAWDRTYAGMKERDGKDKSRGGGFGFAAAALESQRAWLIFRDRQCVIEGGRFAGEAVQPTAQTSCRTRLTRERTRQLQDMRWP